MQLILDNLFGLNIKAPEEEKCNPGICNVTQIKLCETTLPTSQKKNRYILYAD